MITEEQKQARLAELRKEAFNHDVAISYEMWPDTDAFNRGMIQLMHKLRGKKFDEKLRFKAGNCYTDTAPYEPLDRFRDGEPWLDEQETTIVNQIIRHHIDQLKEART